MTRINKSSWLTAFQQGTLISSCLPWTILPLTFLCGKKLATRMHSSRMLTARSLPYWGSLSGGSLSGIPSLRGQTDTSVKSLPCHKLSLRAVKISFHSFYNRWFTQIIYLVSGICPSLTLQHGSIWYRNRYGIFVSRDTQGRYAVGTRATALCRDNYYKSSGCGTRICMSSGQWIGWPAVCSPSMTEIDLSFLVMLILPILSYYRLLIQSD